MLCCLNRIKYLIVICFCLCVGGVNLAQSESVWVSAEELRNNLFQAQMVMFSTKNDGSAVLYVNNALDIYRNELRSEIESIVPNIDQLLLEEFDNAIHAIEEDDALGLANARGQIWTTLLRASFHMTIDYVENNDIESARAWLKIREYRQSTRVSLVENQAVQSLDLLDADVIKLSTAILEIENDLRDTYFFRLRFALEEVEIAINKGFAIRASEWMAYVEGYLRILEADYRIKLGDESLASVSNLIGESQALIVAGNLDQVKDLIPSILESVSYYQPVALTQTEINERAQLLFMFTELVAVEYQDAVRNGEITNTIEYQESTTFLRQSQAVFSELLFDIEASSASDALQLRQLFQELQSIVQSIGERNVVRVKVDAILSLVSANLNVETQSDAEAVFPLISTMLNAMVSAVDRGAYDEAEQLRLEAYALFDFGPEPRLMTFSPDLLIRIEGLFWQGYQDTLGLSRALQAQAPIEDIRSIRQQLDAELNSAQLIIGESSSEPFAIIGNAAVIVFREGLEAVVILAALMAGMVGANLKYRRPLIGGVVLALVATIMTWGLMQGILSSLRIHGEKLEAFVSIVAIAVLLLITNWFFHKVYWNE